MKLHYLLIALAPVIAHSEEFDLDQIPYFQPKTAKTQPQAAAAPIAKPEPKKAQPQAQPQRQAQLETKVVPKHPQKTVENKPDGSRFANKYGPFKKPSEKAKAAKENPKFAWKYKLETDE